MRLHFVTPKWYFILLTLCSCALFIRLGYWQLQRAAEKENLQETFSTRLYLAPLSLKELFQKDDKRYYPVKVTGHYDNVHTVLLDNKMHAHQAGYQVLTPFLFNQNSKAILVNRGWVPANVDRHILPIIPSIIGEQTIVGYVYVVPGKSFTLGSVSEGREIWPLRLQTIDIPLLETKSHLLMHPFILLLAPDAKSGFVRDWQPVAMPAQKHRGYAVQWFTFAGVVIIIFMVLHVRNKTKS